MTPGQRWRLRRSLAIHAAWRGGVCRAWLRDVFDLSKTRVTVILQRMEALARQNGQACPPVQSEEYRAWLLSEKKKTDLRPGKKRGRPS